MPGVWYLRGIVTRCRIGIFTWNNAQSNEQYRSDCFWLGAEGDPA